MPFIVLLIIVADSFNLSLRSNSSIELIDDKHDLSSAFLFPNRIKSSIYLKYALHFKSSLTK